MKDIYESGLPVEIMDCLEMEGHISQDTDPIVKQVYDNRIITPFTPWLQGLASIELYRTQVMNSSISG